jgi:hypothetical protein
MAADAALTQAAVITIMIICELSGIFESVRPTATTVLAGCCVTLCRLQILTLCSTSSALVFSAGLGFCGLDPQMLVTLQSHDSNRLTTGHGKQDYRKLAAYACMQQLILCLSVYQLVA